jgi:arsenate reductase-like glutaredoxin family protein
VVQVKDAKKERMGDKEALALARSVSEILVSRGKKTVRVDMKKDAPSDADLLGLLLGPTGNLRAPTLRKGKTLLVGFDPDAYTRVLLPST